MNPGLSDFEGPEALTKFSNADRVASNQTMLMKLLILQFVLLLRAGVDNCASTAFAAV